MTHYIAIVEDAGPDHAIGVWFSDLPDRFSAGDDLDEALSNAPEAVELYLEDLAAKKEPLPLARTLTELKNDPKVAADIKNYMVAIIEVRRHADAAE